MGGAHSMTQEVSVVESSRGQSGDVAAVCGEKFGEKTQATTSGRRGYCEGWGS